MIIEDVASIGAISHLCRLSNRYAITSQRQLSWLKCLLVKGVARSLSLLPGVDPDRVLIHLPCRVAPSQTGWPGTPLLSPDEIISMALYTCVVSVFRPAPFFSRSVPSICGGSNFDRRRYDSPRNRAVRCIPSSRVIGEQDRSRAEKSGRFIRHVSRVLRSQPSPCSATYSNSISIIESTGDL